MAKKLKIPPGIVRFTARLRAFLGADPAVTVGYNDDTGDIEVTVTGCPFKAEAIEQILVKKITAKSKWCSDDHRILVNGKRCSWKKILTFDTIKTALAGNPYFRGIEVHQMPKEWGGQKRWFGMLSPVVIQAPNDNFGNPYGIDSFLAEYIVFTCFTDEVTDKVAWTTDRK